MSAPRGVSDLEKLTRIFEQLKQHAKYLTSPTTFFKFPVESRLKNIPKADREAVVKMAADIYGLIRNVNVLDSASNQLKARQLISDAHQGKFGDYLREFLEAAKSCLRESKGQLKAWEFTELADDFESLTDSIIELSEYKQLDSVLNGRHAIVLKIESWVVKFQEADSLSEKKFIATKLNEIASVINGNDVLREHLGATILKANTEIARSSVAYSHEVQLLKVIKIQESFINPVDLPDIEGSLKLMLKQLENLKKESEKMQIPIEMGTGRRHRACRIMLERYQDYLERVGVELKQSTAKFQKDFAGSDKFAAGSAYIEFFLSLSETITQALKNLGRKRIVLQNPYWKDALLDSVEKMTNRLEKLEMNAKIKADEVSLTNKAYKEFKKTVIGVYVGESRALRAMEIGEAEKNRVDKEARWAREAQETKEERIAREAREAKVTEEAASREAKEVDEVKEEGFSVRRKKQLQAFHTIMQDEKISQQDKDNLAALRPLMHNVTRLEILVRMLPEESSNALLDKLFLTYQAKEKTVFPTLRSQAKLPTAAENGTAKIPTLKLSVINKPVVQVRPKIQHPVAKSETKLPKP